MILSDTDIKMALGKGRLKIDPLPKPEDIQPASVDVHLGTDFQILRQPYSGYSELDTRKDSTYAFEKIDRHLSFLLPPHSLVLGRVAERLVLPNDIACQVGGRSSIGRLGLQVHVTAGWVDPGWDGYLTLELTNLTDWPTRVYPGDRIAQLIFMKLNTPAREIYNGKYQHATETQVSRSHLDQRRVETEHELACCREDGNCDGSKACHP